MVNVPVFLPAKTDVLKTPRRHRHRRPGDDGGGGGGGMKIKHKLSLPPFRFAVNELIIAKPGASYIYAGIKVVE